MTLLKSPAFPGYPTAYLLPRLRARKGRLTGDWQALLDHGFPPGVSEENLWRDLLKENAWLFRQMNCKLRRLFAPVFTFFEIRTLLLGLRNRMARESGRVEELLEWSLLDEQVLKPLRNSQEEATAMAGLAGQLSREAPEFTPLPHCAEARELKPFETALARCMLGYAAVTGRHPLVEAFLRQQIDLRNLLALAKHRRWQLENLPELLAGGRLPLPKLASLVQTGNLLAVNRLIKKHLGVTTGLTEAGLENALLRGVSQTIRQQAREHEEAGPVLEYLWRRYLETRNLGVLLHGRGLPRETLAAELIS